MDCYYEGGIELSIKVKELVKIIIWSLIGMMSFAFTLFESENYKAPLIYIGIIIILHAFTYFRKHGGRYITPSSLFLLYSALMHGFASIYINFAENYNIVYGHYLGALLVYFSQIFIYHFFLSKTTDENNYILYNNRTDAKYDNLNLAMLIILISLLLGMIIPQLSFIVSISVYTITIYLAIILVFANKKLPFRTILNIIILYLVYIYFFFNGFGRINIATLLVGIVIVIQFKAQYKNLKFITILSFIPLIIIASLLRGGSIDDIGSGMGSIISPFYRYGEMVELYINDRINIVYGNTIYAALAVFVPRSIWQGKPWNFNRQITYIFAPEYVKYGHSEAAVLMAELIFNFGIIISFIFSVIFLGISIKKLDTSIISLSQQKIWKREEILKLTMIIVTASGILNLLWGGFSTFINRDGFRLIFLFILYLINKFVRKHK